jgi:hypothetical protein
MSLLRVALCVAFFFCAGSVLAEGPPSSLPEPFVGTIVALQPDARLQTVSTPRRIILADLSPSLGRVYLLAAKTPQGWQHAHLVMTPPRPGVRLSEDGAVLAFGDDPTCETASLFEVRSVAIAPVCEGLAEVRLTINGYRNSFDAVTDLLRDRFGGVGEQAISIVKSVRGEADKEAADYGASSDMSGSVEKGRKPLGAPADATLTRNFAQRLVARGDQGVELADAPAGQLAIGHWYRAKQQSGVFVSRITPRAAGHASDPETLDAAVDLMAIALDGVRLEYRVGTEHPRLDWAKWVGAQGKGPGPDGIGATAPLARPGIIDPRDKSKLIAVFAGGFKRLHGALQDGTYYGFVEDGVVLTKLRPGLATLYSTVEGRIALDSWAGQPASPLLFARQNGIPILDNGVAGRRLEDRSASWSTGPDGNPRTARGGACIIEGEQRFLVYAYFSSAVPRTMADVFAAYGCRTAMLLDMSRAALAYAAIHSAEGHEPLTRAMRKADPPKGAKFLDQADERDFFAIFSTH